MSRNIETVICGQRSESRANTLQSFTLLHALRKAVAVCIGSPHANVVSSFTTADTYRGCHTSHESVALVSNGVTAIGEPTNRDFSESTMDYYGDRYYNKNSFIIK